MTNFLLLSLLCCFIFIFTGYAIGFTRYVSFLFWMMLKKIGLLSVLLLLVWCVIESVCVRRKYINVSETIFNMCTRFTFIFFLLSFFPLSVLSTLRRMNTSQCVARRRFRPLSEKLCSRYFLSSELVAHFFI